jgi:hypothetical protein
MNKTLQEKLDVLESLIGTQKESIIEGDSGVDYMHGMANGMILAHSVFADNHPNFVTRPNRRRGRIVRHKSAKSKSKRKR